MESTPYESNIMFMMFVSLAISLSLSYFVSSDVILSCVGALFVTTIALTSFITLGLLENYPSYQRIITLGCAIFVVILTLMSIILGINKEPRPPRYYRPKRFKAIPTSYKPKHK